MLTRLEDASIGASLPLSEVLTKLLFDQQGLGRHRPAVRYRRGIDAGLDETLVTGFACYWTTASR